MSKLVLVVDDDAPVRASIRAVLESCGYAVEEADNARDAVGMLVTRRPDLILTDIYMPGSDGFELLESVREVADPIPIVVMSGGGRAETSVDYLELAQKLGAAGIIDKPFRATTLLETIDRAIAGRGGPPRR